MILVITLDRIIAIVPLWTLYVETESSGASAESEGEGIIRGSSTKGASCCNINFESFKGVESTQTPVSRELHGSLRGNDDNGSLWLSLIAGVAPTTHSDTCLLRARQGTLNPKACGTGWGFPD